MFLLHSAKSRLTMCLCVMILCSTVIAQAAYYRHRPRTTYPSGSPRVYSSPHSSYRSTVVSLPAGHRRVVVGGNPYYYYNGMYYRYGPSGYTVVNAPAGAVVQTVAPGAIPVHVNGREYYISNGVYYNRGPSGYAVVSAPVGGMIWSLPVGARPMYYNGQQCYYYGNVYYRPVYRDGRQGYVIVR